MFHELFKWWFEHIHQWGYWGISGLMALESTIVPIPSEVIVPPAAYWASQGRFDFWLVVISATLGAYLGSILSYLVCWKLGRPLLYRYGKYLGLTQDKLHASEKWLLQYSYGGVFFARLLPVLRHLISMPAGILGMNFWKFSMATFSGALIWSYVLAWFGQEVIGNSPNLMNDPEELIHALKAKMLWLVIAILALSCAYFGVKYWLKKQKSLNAVEN